MSILSVPALADGPVETARGQFDAGQYAEALKVLQAALNQSPQDAQIHFWLARCYFELRNFNQAAASAERAVQLDTQNSEYHLWLGHAYGQRADRERSLRLARRTKREFEQAVRLDKNNVKARRALVDYLSQAPWIAGGDDDEARKQAEALATLDPVEGHLARADYYRNNDEWERAAAEIRHVLQLKSNRIEPYAEVARFYVKRRDAAGLEAAVEAAARVNPSDPRLGFFRGVALILRGSRDAEAERYSQEYLKTLQRSDYPSHASAREWLGKLYEKQGRCREAAEQYRMAVQSDPKLKEAREGLKRLSKCASD